MVMSLEDRCCKGKQGKHKRAAHRDACPAEQVGGSQAPAPQEQALLGLVQAAGHDLVHQAALQGLGGRLEVALQCCMDLQASLC